MAVLVAMAMVSSSVFPAFATETNATDVEKPNTSSSIQTEIPVLDSNAVEEDTQAASDKDETEDSEEASDGDPITEEEKDYRIDDFTHRTYLTTDWIVDNVDEDLVDNVEEAAELTKEEEDSFKDKEDKSSEDEDESSLFDFRSLISSVIPTALADEKSDGKESVGTDSSSTDEGDVTLKDGYDENGLGETYHDVYLQYTLVDDTKETQDITVKELWDKHSEAFIGNYPVALPVYAINGNDDYFVAFADPSQFNMTGTAIYADFVNYDAVNPVCYNDIIKYDKDTGVIYIPKSFYYNEDGEEVVNGLQAQILLLYDSENSPKSEIAVEVQNAIRGVELVNEVWRSDTDLSYMASQTLKAETLDVTTTIPIATPETANKIELSNIQVYVNDSNEPMYFDGENAFYDRTTGELTIAGSPVDIYSIFIAVGEIYQTATTKIADAASMKAFPYMTVSGDLADDDYFDYTTAIHYVSNIKTATAEQKEIMTYTSKYLYLSTGAVDSTIRTLYSYIKDGGHSINDYIKIADFGLRSNTKPTQNGLGLFNFIVSMPSQVKGKSQTSHGGRTSTWTTRGGRTDSNSFVALHCGEGITPLYPISNVESNWDYRPNEHCRLRIIYVNKAEKYVVIGIAAPSSNRQAGSGIFKIPITDEDDKKGYIDVTKTWYDDVFTKLQGAEFTIKDSSGKVVTTMTTNANGYAKSIGLEAGTYTVTETKAPAGYEINDYVFTAEVKENETTTAFTWDSQWGKVWPDKSIITDGPPGGPSSTGQKYSTNPDISANNPCYSLAGAKYNVWCSDCGKYVGSTTTNAAGQFTKLPVHQHWLYWYTSHSYDSEGNITGSTDHYHWEAVSYSAYAKEVTPAKGFALCTETHTFTVGTDGGFGFKCGEVPLDDPFALQLQKADADTGKPEAQGTASLEGALFAVDYYANTDEDTSGTPYRSWVYQTDENGKIYVRDEAYLIVEDSDELYRDENGDIVFPVGTYHVYEIQPPKYYQLSGTIRFANSNIKGSASVTEGLIFMVEDKGGYAQVSYNGTGISASNLSLNVYDEIYRGSVKVLKYDSDGKTPLSGVSFKLVGDDGSTYTGKSDSSGTVLFDELIPQHYILTETATVDGHQLLKDNIDIDIPLEMSWSDIGYYNADRSKAVFDAIADAYCFYDITYEVSNAVNFTVPTTGGNPKILYTALAIAFAAMGTGVVIIMKRRKAREET